MTWQQLHLSSRKQTVPIWGSHSCASASGVKLMHRHTLYLSVMDGGSVRCSSCVAVFVS